MNNEKIYANPNLKIIYVPDLLRIPSHELSKLVNQNLNSSFTKFLLEKTQK